MQYISVSAEWPHEEPGIAADKFVIQPEWVHKVTVRPLDLPDFTNPPVAETALSAQFERLSSMQTAHLGLYWSEIRERFPRTEEHGELPSLIELPADQPQPPVGIQFQALEAPPTPRLWFVDEAGTALIQVQRDRFIKNWRKTGEGDEYPRYERVREGFDRDFAGFAEFASRNELGAIRQGIRFELLLRHVRIAALVRLHEPDPAVADEVGDRDGRRDTPRASRIAVQPHERQIPRVRFMVRASGERAAPRRRRRRRSCCDLSFRLRARGNQKRGDSGGGNVLGTRGPLHMTATPRSLPAQPAWMIPAGVLRLVELGDRRARWGRASR